MSDIHRHFPELFDPPPPPDPTCCECGTTVRSVSAGGRCAACEFMPHAQVIADLSSTPSAVYDPGAGMDFDIELPDLDDEAAR